TPEARELLDAVRKLQVQSAKSAVSPDGRSRVEANRDLIQMVDVATGKLIWQTKGGGEVNGVAFSPDGKMVAAGSGGGDIHMMDGRTGKIIRLMRVKVAIAGVSFSEDGKLLKTVDADGTVHVWDIAT